MPDSPAPRLSRLLSMGSHPCLPRPSVCGSLEPTALSMKLVLVLSSLVERVSLRVCVTISHSLMLFIGRDRWFSSCTSHFFGSFDLLPGRRDISSHFLLAWLYLVAYLVGSENSRWNE